MIPKVRTMTFGAEERSFFTLKPINTLSTYYPTTFRTKKITLIGETMFELLVFGHESKALGTLVSLFTIVYTMGETYNLFMVTTIPAFYYTTTGNALKREVVGILGQPILSTFGYSTEMLILFE